MAEFASAVPEPRTSRTSSDRSARAKGREPVRHAGRGPAHLESAPERASCDLSPEAGTGTADRATPNSINIDRATSLTADIDATEQADTPDCTPRANLSVASAASWKDGERLIERGSERNPEGGRLNAVDKIRRLPHRPKFKRTNQENPQLSWPTPATEGVSTQSADRPMMRTAAACRPNPKQSIAKRVLFAIASMLVGCEIRHERPAPIEVASESEHRWSSRVTGVSARVRGEIDFRDMTLLALRTNELTSVDPTKSLEVALGERVVWSRPAYLNVWGTPRWRAAISRWPTSDTTYTETRIWGEAESVQWESLLFGQGRVWPKGRFPDAYARADYFDQAQFLCLAPDPGRRLPDLAALTGVSAITLAEACTLPLLIARHGALRQVRNQDATGRSLTLLTFSEPHSNARYSIFTTTRDSTDESHLVFCRFEDAAWPLGIAPNLQIPWGLYPEDIGKHLEQTNSESTLP